MAKPPDIDVEIGRIDLPRRNPAQAGPHGEPRRTPAAAGPQGATSAVAPTAAPSRALEARRNVEAGSSTKPALPEPDPVGDAIDVVGWHVGRAVAYLRTQTASAMRADAERVIVANPVLALTAALGFGYLVGRQVRR